MADEDEGGLTPSQMASGFLDGNAEAIKQAGEPMLRGAKPITRFVMKRIPGAPALVFDATELLTAPNKTRAAFGLIGGALGGVAGGALGTAAGGVNAPIGAAVGSTFGENLGEQIYDENRKAIDGVVDPQVRRVREGLGTFNQWLADRTALAR